MDNFKMIGMLCSTVLPSYYALFSLWCYTKTSLKAIPFQGLYALFELPANYIGKFFSTSYSLHVETWRPIFRHINISFSMDRFVKMHKTPKTSFLDIK